MRRPPPLSLPAPPPAAAGCTCAWPGRSSASAGVLRWSRPGPARWFSTCIDQIESWSAFLEIGDGAIVILDDGVLRPVFWPQSGEYLNTTYFVTDSDFDNDVAIDVLHKGVTGDCNVH